MQRKPFKKSHKLRNTLIAFLAFIISVLVIFVVLGRNNQTTAKNNVSESTAIKKHKSSKKASSTIAESSTSELPASESTSVAQAPVAASSAVSSAISIATNDATQTPITDNTTAESSVAPSTASSVVEQPNVAAPVSFGKWSSATYNSVSIGSATYEQIRATYGAPTYMVASDQLYATWQSTSGIKVSIVFTPTGDADNLKLIASSKMQTGLQ